MKIVKIKEVDFNKMLQDLEKRMDEMQVQTEGFWEPQWKTHKLILPRIIRGKLFWPGQTVARRHHLSPGGGYWEYGTSFDVLRDSR